MLILIAFKTSYRQPNANRELFFDEKITRSALHTNDRGKEFNKCDKQTLRWIN